MATTWVLIITIFHFSGWGYSPAIGTAEFLGETACQNAAAAYKEQITAIGSGDKPVIKTLCVPWNTAEQ